MIENAGSIPLYIALDIVLQLLYALIKLVAKTGRVRSFAERSQASFFWAGCNDKFNDAYMTLAFAVGINLTSMTFTTPAAISFNNCVAVVIGAFLILAPLKSTCTLVKGWKKNAATVENSRSSKKLEEENSRSSEQLKEGREGGEEQEEEEDNEAKHRTSSADPASVSHITDVTNVTMLDSDRHRSHQQEPEQAPEATRFEAQGRLRDAQDGSATIAVNSGSKEDKEDGNRDKPNKLLKLED